MCLASSKHFELLNEHLSSSQRQLKACFAVISHSSVLALVLITYDDVAESVNKDTAPFMYGTNLTQSDNHQFGNGHRRGLWGCQTIAVMSWIQMQYAFWDPWDVKIERVIKLFANVCRRMREILCEWKDPVWKIVNWGAAFSEDQLACNGISSSKTIETLWIIIATLPFANETWILINSVNTARRCTSISPLRSLCSVVTSMIE